MTEAIQHYENDLNKQIDDFEDDVNKSPYEFNNRQKWINDCNKKIGKIRELIFLYQHQLGQLTKDQNIIYTASLKSLQSRFNKSTDTYNSKKGQKKTGVDSLFQGRQEDVPLDQLNVTQLIQKGDNLQNKMVDIIMGMNVTLDQTIQIADEVNKKLNDQIEQLDRMTNKVKDTGSTLKVAQKHISYFKKALQCDKWLAALLFLNLLALITLIILVIKKVKKNK